MFCDSRTRNTLICSNTFENAASCADARRNAEIGRATTGWFGSTCGHELARVREWVRACTSIGSGGLRRRFWATFGWHIGAKSKMYHKCIKDGSSLTPYICRTRSFVLIEFVTAEAATSDTKPKEAKGVCGGTAAAGGRGKGAEGIQRTRGDGLTPGLQAREQFQQTRCMETSRLAECDQEIKSTRKTSAR